MNLTTQLFDAFASRPRPTADRIIKSYAHEGDELRELLADLKREELSATDIRRYVRDNLWMLTPEAFKYLLPALMAHALGSSGSSFSIDVELVGMLTAPSRADIIEKYARLSQMPLVGGLTPAMLDMVGKQELEMFDAGDTSAAFHERVDDLTRAEGEAVLAFLETLRKEHAENYPFGELETAIDRHWSRYRSA
jgi:hypothetical protein